MCDAVSVDLPALPEAYFPQNDACSCLTDLAGPSESYGIGCKLWDEDGNWCYVSEDCGLEKMPSGNFEGLFWSIEICDAEYSHPETLQSISLSANVENYGDNAVSNADITMYAACAVASLVAIVWQAKSIFATKKNVALENEGAYERFI